MASTPTSTGAPARASRGDPHPPNAQPATDPGGPHTDTARSSRGRPFATVWVCPVDPPFRINDVVAAAIRTLVTSYTQPGDRVLLAIPSRPGPGIDRTDSWRWFSASAAGPRSLPPRTPETITPPPRPGYAGPRSPRPAPDPPTRTRRSRSRPRRSLESTARGRRRTALR